MKTFVLISALGALGVVARYWALQWGQTWGADFGVYTIFLCNLVGSFLMGGVVSAKMHWPHFAPTVTLAIGVGFLGGLTTFSAYSFDTFKLIMDGQFLKAVIYFIGTPILSLLGCSIGYYVVKALTSFSS